MTQTTFSRRNVLAGAIAVALVPGSAWASGAAAQIGMAWPERLIFAARLQIGVTVRYDPAYTRLDFPGGDVPREIGVCTDVIIRAYRDAFGLDLQALVNADMRRAFAEYPRKWGLSRPDPSIDHRRVLNLRVYLARRGHEVRSELLAPEVFAPGDLATQILPSNLPHIGIVSDRRAESGRLMMIHNIGIGAQENDVLAQFPLTGRYRFAPT